MWGAFFTFGIPMFIIGCMAGVGFGQKKKAKRSCNSTKAVKKLYISNIAD